MDTARLLLLRSRQKLCQLLLLLLFFFSLSLFLLFSLFPRRSLLPKSWKATFAPSARDAIFFKWLSLLAIAPRGFEGLLLIIPTERGGNVEGIVIKIVFVSRPLPSEYLLLLLVKILKSHWHENNASFLQFHYQYLRLFPTNNWRRKKSRSWIFFPREESNIEFSDTLRNKRVRE